MNREEQTGQTETTRSGQTYKVRGRQVRRDPQALGAAGAVGGGQAAVRRAGGK